MYRVRHQLVTQIMRLPNRRAAPPILLVPPSLWNRYFSETRCWSQIFSKNIATAAGRNDFREEELKIFCKSNSVEEMFKSLDDALVMEEWQPKIPRVPYILRADNHFKKYYEPRMVSIGPYHSQNSNLKVTLKLKYKIAAHFIQYHNLSKEFMYSEIKREITNLRKFYDEEFIKHHTDEDLTKMFLLDGCTLMHYICSSTNEEYLKFKESMIKVDCSEFVNEDIFLLENQLPFPVLLKLLMNCPSDKSDQMRRSIEKFIGNSIKALGEKYCDQQVEVQPLQEINDEPTHLLDLLRTTLLHSFTEDPTPASTKSKPNGKVLESPSHQKQDFCFFRSVEELKAAGIRFKRSRTSRLTDVTFKFGTLNLPPIIVDDSSTSKFLNLTAYEMCPDFINDFGISSYIVFLDSLIDRAQDVKELRDNQILHHILGSDEEVVKLFNKVSTSLKSNPEKYLVIRRNIQERYDDIWTTWIAQFNHQHFQSPWSVLAFLAATILLFSSLLQTFYTWKGC